MDAKGISAQVAGEKDTLSGSKLGNKTCRAQPGSAVRETLPAEPAFGYVFDARFLCEAEKSGKVYAVRRSVDKTLESLAGACELCLCRGRGEVERGIMASENESSVLKEGGLAMVIRECARSVGFGERA
jgi:hypothetical protein